MTSTWFLRFGVLSALVGMGLGILMGASHDHSLAPVHAHVNLVGFTAMFLAGLFYRVHPQAEGALAGIHLGLAMLGVLTLCPGVAGIVLGRPWGEPLAIGGSMLTIASMAVFALVVFRHTGAGRVMRDTIGVRREA